MAFPTIPLPSVWDLPVAAGVPALLGQSTGAGLSASVSTLAGQEISALLVESAAEQWGIFNSSGNRVLTAAHVMGVEYESQYQVSDAPLEDGGFTSYGKVRVPFSSRILMVCDGSEIGFGGLTQSFQSVLSGITGSGPLAVRKDFLSTLDTIVADTNLYTIVTPERSYVNANIVGYRFRRSAEGGITMPAAEIALQEIRRTATTAYHSTRTAAGAGAIQAGTVQPTTATTSVNDAMAGMSA